MKKLVFILLLCPFLGSPVSSFGSEEFQSSSQESTVQQSSETEAARWRRVRCGRNSDHKCWGRRVYDACEKDPSHGYYGRCDNYGQRTPDVVCFCR